MSIEHVGTLIFALAILHTFMAGRFRTLGHRFPEGSIPENFFHLLGETEVVFGLWSLILFVVMSVTQGWHHSVEFMEGRNYTEPLFVMTIMTMAATRPILMLSTKLIKLVARVLPLPAAQSFYVTALVVGPLLGSFITEPAAMTIVALLLKERYYDKGISRRMMYVTLAVLFVNVSVGGTLTHFAAPPVLMVAGKWGWGISHMFMHFGWKSAIGVVINAVGAFLLCRGELAKLGEAAEHLRKSTLPEMKAPAWLMSIHVAFLAFVVVTAHHPVMFMGALMFFLGVVMVTAEYQDQIRLKEGALVGFFLAGLVVLGSLQTWWLQPLLSSMGNGALFVGATGLTAITDNAALTYLGSLVEGLSDQAKYALVAGAVAGGGLTVIANAPNPAGFGILKGSFDDVKAGKNFSPLALLVSALPPTLVVMACLWFLP